MMMMTIRGMMMRPDIDDEHAEWADIFVWVITLFAVVGFVSFVGGLLVGWLG
jgi:hypothetical protein